MSYVKWIAIDEAMPPPHRTIIFRCKDRRLFQGEMIYGPHEPRFCNHSMDGREIMLQNDGNIKVTHWILRDDLLG